MEYSCLIVDDEKPQQEILSGMLTSKFPSYRLEAICSSVDEGIKKIKQIFFILQYYFLPIPIPIFKFLRDLDPKQIISAPDPGKSSGSGSIPPPNQC